MDEGVWEAACCVRPYLPELLGTVLAAEVDDQLSGLLNGGGGDLENRLREVLNAHEATSVFLEWVIDDAPAFRPPGLSGSDKFACPGSDYVWYRPASWGLVPQCPTHQSPLQPLNAEEPIRPRSEPARPPLDTESARGLADGGSEILGQALDTRDSASFDKAVDLLERARDALPADHPDQPGVLSNLGTALYSRYDRTGRAEDLEEAVEAYRQAAGAAPQGHPGLPGILSDLGGVLLRRFESTGKVEDLEEAVGAYRQAAGAAPQGHPGLPGILSSLASVLYREFSRTGQVEDLDEAVQAYRQAAEAAAQDDPGLPGILKKPQPPYERLSQPGGASGGGAPTTESRGVDGAPPVMPDTRRGGRRSRAGSPNWRGSGVTPPAPGDAPPEVVARSPRSGRGEPGREPAAQTLSVYPRVDGPDVVIVGGQFDLHIGVSRRRDRNLLIAGPMSLPTLGPVTLGLLVTYDPQSLQLEGVSPSHLHLDPANPVATETVRFTVLDGEDLATERRVGVHYLMDGVLIGIAWKRLVAVESEVERSRTTLPGNRENTLLDLTPIVSEQAPDLVVAIYHADDRTRDHFVWAAYPKAPGLVVPDLKRSRSIGDDAKQFATNWRRTVAAEREARSLFHELHGRALGIGRAVPYAIQRTLYDLVADPVRAVPPSVLLLTEEVHVPWELAAFRKPYALDSAETRGESPFLGAHVAISRWPLTDERPRPILRTTLEVRGTAVISAKYDGVPKWKKLEHAELEASDLVASYPPAHEIKPLYMDVMNCINGNPDAQVMHFAMHGQFDPDGNNEGLVLLNPHDDGTFSPEFLTPYQIESAELHGALVFLNACQVGSAKEILGDYAGLAVSFLRAGASGVIAPVWNIDDEVAGSVARNFYAAIYSRGPSGTNAVSVAEAIRRIRGGYFLSESTGAVTGHSTLIAYQFFGHPRLVLNAGRIGNPQSVGASNG